MANGEAYLGQGGRVPVHLSNRTGAIPVYESTDVNAMPVFYGTGGGSIPVKVVSRLVGGSMPVRFGAGAVPPPTPPVTVEVRITDASEDRITDSGETRITD